MGAEKKKKLLGVLLVVSSLAVNGCGQAAQTQSGQQDAPVEQNESRVEQINAWGEVTYSEGYLINVDFPATVLSIAVKAGDEVKQGDVLATLDTAAYQNTIAKIEAQLSAGQAALDGVVQDTAYLEAQIAQAQRDLTTAQEQMDKNKVLYEAGGLSQTAYDQIVQQRDGAATQLAVYQAQIKQLERTNQSNETQQESSNEALRQELAIYQGKLNNKPYLSGGQLICPLPRAIVSDVTVQNGALLGEAGIQVMRLIDADSIYISAEVEEEFIRSIRLDTPVTIVPTSNPDKIYTGHILMIPAAAELKDGDRIIKVRVAADDPDHELKPGYTVDVYFEKE